MHGFVHVPLSEITQLDLNWIEPIEGMTKVSMRELQTGLLVTQTHKLWKLPYDAAGRAVTTITGDHLFICYLRGQGLFGKVTSEDLLAVARDEGCRGMMAEVYKPTVKRILARLGFVYDGDSPDGGIYMRLTDA